VLGVDEPAAGFSVNPPPCAVAGTDRTMMLGTLTQRSGVEIRTDFTLARRDGRWLIDDIVSRLAPTVPSETQRRLARLPLLKPSGEYQPDDLVNVQAALINLCAARGDMATVLSLPGHFGLPEAADWRARLDDRVGLSSEVTLSYAAAYHPWLQQRETDSPTLAPLRAVPPDGSICGMIAARELARGAWVAPAGVPLRGVVGLAPALSDAECGALFDAPTQINPVRQQPGRFAAISAHTLSPEPIYWQISVRRLLILLRKLALRRGMQYVFESNNERFRRQVRGSFERALARLVDRGALAAYQVVADEGLNTQNDIDNGRFLIALKVAPVAPVEFITVTLLRSGEGLLDVVER
jgi:phage tail sheath protein FI